MTIIIFCESLFPPGEVVVTQGALEDVPEIEIGLSLNRHLQGDWGDVCEEDKQRNNAALVHEERLLSAYHTAGGVKFWIITEADRSATTVLLPDEY